MKLNWDKPEGDAWKAYETTVSGSILFWRNAAPLVFTWLGWCGLLALVRYVELKTGQWPLTALKWLLGILLWGYFVAFLFSTEKVEWKTREEVLAWSTWLRVLLSIAATAGLVASSYWFADAFMEHPL